MHGAARFLRDSLDDDGCWRSHPVPFAEAGEREQGLRARAFADAGLLRVLDPEALEPAALAAALAEAAAADPPRRRPALDGAAATARLLLQVS